MNLLAALLLSMVQNDPDTPARLVPPVTVSPAEARPGDIVKLTVTVDVDPMWHIYSANGKEIKTEFEFEGMPVKIAGKIEEPAPTEFKPKGLDETHLVHEGKRVAFVIPLQITDKAKPGDLEIKGTVGPTVCDENRCVPFSAEFAFKLKIQDTGAAPQKKAHARLVAPASVSPAEAKVGDIVKLTVEVDVDPAWHIYSANEKDVKTEFDFEGMPVELAGKIEEPPPTLFEPKGLNEKHLVHEGKRVKFVVPLRIAAKAAPGELTIKGTVGDQVCNDKRCEPYKEDVSVKIRVLPSSSQEKPAGQGGLMSGGLLGFLGICIGGGLISLFMPCVYPMIPITLTFFVKQGAGSRAKSLGLSSAYAAGIVISFTAIGMILSVLLGGDGARVFAADPWVNLIIALMFTVFAVSLFGVFEISLPGGLTNAVAGSPRAGIAGAFILGLTFSVVTFTCTIPVTAALLALAATGSGSWALFGMLVYSGTMALPFLLLGLFPGALGKVPRSGGWLHNVKICAAFLEIALAVKYFANADFAWGFDAMSRDLGVIVWILCTGFASLYLLDIYRFSEDTKLEYVGFVRFVIAALFAGMAIFMFTGLGEKPLGFMDALLPPFKKDISPAAEGGKPGEAPKESWLDGYEKGLEEAKKTHTPIFIDFTGFT